MMISYFVPEISNFFKENGISPEYYSSSWILTALAGKTEDVNILYMLWEEFIDSDIPYYCCLACVAMLDIHKKQILDQDCSSILIYVTSISLSSIEVLTQVIEKARFYKNSLPESIKYWLKAFIPFDLKDIDYKFDVITNFKYFELLPFEFFTSLYPEKFGFSSLSFVLIDCRLSSDQNSGYLPNSALFSLEKLNQTQAVEDFVQSFSGIKGFSHFVLMTNKTITDTDPINLMIQVFIKHQFPFLSVSNGGYSACHSFAKDKKLKIKSHYPQTCKECLETRNFPKNLIKYFKLQAKSDKIKFKEHKNWF